MEEPKFKEFNQLLAPLVLALLEETMEDGRRKEEQMRKFYALPVEPKGDA